MSSFKFIIGFDCVTYFAPNTTDSERAAMRNDYILKEFKRLYPLINFDSNDSVLKFLSVDKAARSLYKGLNSEFHSLLQLESAYSLEGLTSEQRDLVISQVIIAKKAASDCGTKIKLIADKARSDISDTIKIRDGIFSKLSPLTLVSLVTIENLPYHMKSRYLSITDKTLAKVEAKKIIDEYKRELIQGIINNNGHFPDGKNPLQ